LKFDTKHEQRTWNMNDDEEHERQKWRGEVGHCWAFLT
jgi:hypothetical protein